LKSEVEDLADAFLTESRIAAFPGRRNHRMSNRLPVGLLSANIGGSLQPALHEEAAAAAGMVGHYHLMGCRRPTTMHFARLPKPDDWTDCGGTSIRRTCQ
jgi:hypothetical protein